MTTAYPDYKLTGVQRLTGFKSSFDPTVTLDLSTIDDFVNTFCEYQLADNNYMNIQPEAGEYKNKDDWFRSLDIDEVLRFITYIIWTDKLVDGYLLSKTKDHTLYHLLARLEDISAALILPATSD